MAEQMTIKAARVHPWLDTSAMEPRFGVEVLFNGKWRHLAIEGKAAIFETRELAEDNCAEIMRQAGAARPGSEG